MIFVTLGTDHHPFPRLLQWLQKALEGGFIAQEDVLVQHGYTQPFDAPEVRWVPFLSYSDMARAMQAARLVVTHPSTTALEVIDRGKVPLVVARRKDNGEIVDDHQEEFVQECAGVLPMRVARSYEEFLEGLSAGSNGDERFAILERLRSTTKARLLAAFSEAFPGG